MIKTTDDSAWKKELPYPIYEEYPQFTIFYEKAWELARAHIKDLPNMPQTPYMDEGFCDTQIWIWDTCFMSLFCKFAQQSFPGVESLRNFYEVLYGGKSLPTVIPTQDEPSWTGAIPGQPFAVQVHIADNPSLFAWAEEQNAVIRGDKEYLKDLLYERKILQRHYEWIESLRESLCLPGVSAPTRLINEKIGYKWEGGRSGMDNTPRGRAYAPFHEERPNNPNMLWIDAVCQQALSARSIARLFKLIKDDGQAREWEEKYHEKKRIINRYYWDKEDGFYYDIDCEDLQYYKVKTIASYWALTAGVADEEQAEKLLKYLKDEKYFGGKVPFVSLARSDVDFSPKGKYWRGGVWLPTAYAALKGLAEYGFYEEARASAKRLLSHMWNTYRDCEPHTIWECYAPDFCAPGMQTDDKTRVRPDFCGWSALGPISIYIEYVLGFHTINAFERLVKWEKPTAKGKVGVKNLKFGDVVTDIIAEGGSCRVLSNEAYILQINGKDFSISAGENEICL